MIWLAALLSFAGGLLGAGIPAYVAVSGQRQGARKEGRERLDRAVDLLVSDDMQRRLIGHQLLAELIDSDLGSREDRALARRVSVVRIRFSRQPPPSTRLESGADAGDTGNDEGK